ncbi:NAD(P)-binding protein [Rhodotorula sp. JG-1b]|nr:NAD(P)-binding protein [Rhodotorula sp. JG-1b]
MTSPRLRRAFAPESYAVIGGEGFLGAALVSELLERHPASSVASFGLTQRRFDTPTGGDPYRFFRTDITSYDSILSALRDSAATTVFHTASPHAKSTPEVWRKVNIEGTDAVVRACREAGVRKLVFTSSMTVVYEPGTPYKNVDERLPIIETEEKVATYAGSKAAAEKIVLAANGQDGLKTPGDRQVLPGFIKVYKSGQSVFQMGDNSNLFDFVTVKNVVHAHLLAAERLDAPPLPASTFVTRLEPVQCTVKRRPLPTSRYQHVIDPSKPAPPPDPPLPAVRNKWNQFACSDDKPVSAENLTVAGQAFFITNGEPVNFWTFARAVYFEYSQRPPRWWDPLVFPKEVGMLYASLSETIGWFQGKKPEDCAVPKAYMQQVLHDLYCDIERARRLLGYEPIESLEEGIRTGVAWYKADEARQERQAAAGAGDSLPKRS